MLFDLFDIKNSFDLLDPDERVELMDQYDRYVGIKICDMR